MEEFHNLNGPIKKDIHCLFRYKVSEKLVYLNLYSLKYIVCGAATIYGFASWVSNKLQRLHFVDQAIEWNKELG